MGHIRARVQPCCWRFPYTLSFRAKLNDSPCVSFGGVEEPVVFIDVAYTVPKLKDFSPATLNGAEKDFLTAFKREAEDVRQLAKNPTADLLNKRTAFKQFRDRWMARANGLLAQSNENWLKAAPPEQKGNAGRTVNKIRALLKVDVDDLERHVNFCATASPEALAKMHPSQAADTSAPQLPPVGRIHISLP